MPNHPRVNTIFNQTFKYTKKLAKAFYFQTWAKNPPQCPAFHNETITIGREGWEHTIEPFHRTKMDILGRLFCLEIAKVILETAPAFQDYRQSQEKEYWIFEAIMAQIKVRVIIRSIQGGHKHFYSVIRKGSVEREIGTP